MEFEKLLTEIKEIGKVSEIYLKNPRIMEVSLCKHCNKINTPLQITYNVRCRFCNQEYADISNPDLFFTYAKQILIRLKRKNTLMLYLDTKWRGAEDILEGIAEVFIGLRETSLMLIEVHGPFKEYKVDKNKCNVCGVCNQCIRCLSCDEIFSQEEVCPKCGSDKTVKLYFDKVKYNKKDKKYLCPNCNSENIKFTIFNANGDTCPSCGTNKIIGGIRKEYNVLVIRRIGGAILKK